MKKHLAIFTQEGVKEILSGKRKVEARFSQKRIAPFGCIGAGDSVYIKPPGEEIVGQFRVKKVVSFENPSSEDWEIIEGSWGVNKTYVQAHKTAKYGTLIFIGSVEQFITSPIKINKSDLRGWVVLG